MSRRPVLALFAPLVLVTLAGAWPGAARAAPVGSFFQSVEVRSTNLTPFTKWLSAVSRALEEQATAGQPCAASASGQCQMADWQAFLAETAGLPPRQQVERINTHMNRADYIIDPVNWGMPDYWASPGQFLRREGDCEDYAIAKYMSLRALGFDPSAMRIVVLQDMNLNIAHAVLLLDLNGERLILDNQIGQVVTADVIRHYRPLYSINEGAWWLHRPAG
ncbi:MAG: transglutaminase-like cysteine peptidase [Alphaproteobacteria bacterium]